MSPVGPAVVDLARAVDLHLIVHAALQVWRPVRGGRRSIHGLLQVLDLLGDVFHDDVHLDYLFPGNITQYFFDGLFTLHSQRNLSKKRKLSSNVQSFSEAFFVDYIFAISFVSAASPAAPEVLFRLHSPGQFFQKLVLLSKPFAQSFAFPSRVGVFEKEVALKLAFADAAIRVAQLMTPTELVAGRAVAAVEVAVGVVAALFHLPFSVSLLHALVPLKW